MRVKCSSVTDFLINLRAFSVYNSIVYFDRTRVPINGTTAGNATSFAFFLNLSAIIDHEDGGQALLECEEECGIDRETMDGGKEGSKRQEALMKELMSFCVEQKLKLLPGVLDI